MTSNPIHLHTAADDSNDTVEVERLALEPFTGSPTPGSTLIAAARAAHRNGHLPRQLPDGAARTIAVALTEPKEAVLARVRSGLTKTSTQSADVTVVRGTSAAPLILPGDQPRGASRGGRALQVDEPIEADDAEATHGLRALQFRDLAHVRAWVTDSIERSLDAAAHTERAREIAATGVRRHLMVSPTLITFADGTPSQWVLMAHDGITRLSLCRAALLGVDPTDTARAAEQIGADMVPTRLPANAGEQALVKRARKSVDRFVSRYAAGLVEGRPSEDAVWVRQHLHVPIDLHLAATDPAAGVPARLQPSMVALVSDAHTGVAHWEGADARLHVMRRAVNRMAERGEIHEDMLQVIHYPITDNEEPGALLRRAVDIVAFFFGRENFDATKRALRDETRYSKMTRQRAMSYLAPLICQPWGAAKPDSGAWNHGGVALTCIAGGTYTPVHPDCHLTLVDQALHGDERDAEEARLELAVAGGIALIADGLLPTTFVGGSGGARESLAFRGYIDDAIDALTRTEEGLTALALAADNFDPRVRADTARHPQVDLTAFDRITRDGTGTPIAITPTILAQYAAAGLTGDRPFAEHGVPALTSRLAGLVADLPYTVHELLTTFEEIVDLREKEDTPTASGLTLEDHNAIHQDLLAILAALASIR